MFLKNNGLQKKRNKMKIEIINESHYLDLQGALHRLSVSKRGEYRKKVNLRIGLA